MLICGVGQIPEFGSGSRIMFLGSQEFPSQRILTWPQLAISPELPESGIRIGSRMPKADCIVGEFEVCRKFQTHPYSRPSSAQDAPGEQKPRHTHTHIHTETHTRTHTHTYTHTHTHPLHPGSKGEKREVHIIPDRCHKSRAGWTAPSVQSVMREWGMPVFLRDRKHLNSTESQGSSIAPKGPTVLKSLCRFWL